MFGIFSIFSECVEKKMFQVESLDQMVANAWEWLYPQQILACFDAPCSLNSRSSNDLMYTTGLIAAIMRKAN